jgi:hypothetical protein
VSAGIKVERFFYVPKTQHNLQTRNVNLGFSVDWRFCFVNTSPPAGYQQNPAKQLRLKPASDVDSVPALS